MSHRTLPLASLAGLSLLCAGCAVGTLAPVVAPPAPTVTAGHSIRGVAYGGEQPLGGSSIQLYSAGTSGYGSAATALLGTPVTSSSTGSFSTGNINCTNGTQVYLTVTGGNSGAGNNPNALLVLALGPCSGVNNITTTVVVNEISTIAAVYAIGPFIAQSTASATAIGSSSANASSGLLNAFADVNMLFNYTTGQAPGPALPAGATFSTPLINTVADILAACINSTGGTAGDNSNCGTLFKNAYSYATTAQYPTDTFQAAYNMIYGYANIGPLYTLATPTSPFQPTLPSQPGNFVLAVNYPIANAVSPSSLAFDGTGYWITDKGANTVSRFSHAGVLQSGFPYSIASPTSVAVDTLGNAFVASSTNSQVIELGPAGQLEASVAPHAGGLNLPTSLSIDPQANVWVGNAGNSSLSEFTQALGTTVSPTNGFTATGIATPLGVANSTK